MSESSNLLILKIIVQTKKVTTYQSQKIPHSVRDDNRENTDQKKSPAIQPGTSQFLCKKELFMLNTFS
jgi:hypothetical protein